MQLEPTTEILEDLVQKLKTMWLKLLAFLLTNAIYRITLFSASAKASVLAKVSVLLTVLSESARFRVSAYV